MSMFNSKFNIYCFNFSQNLLETLKKFIFSDVFRILDEYLQYSVV